jgi:hypothetical protein
MKTQPNFPHITAEQVRETARLVGLELSLERAAELVPTLEPILRGDAEIARLVLEDADG